MKCLKQPFSFIIWIGLLSSHANYIYAEDTIPKAVEYSTYAYNPNNFCAEDGAEKVMIDLEKVNAKKFEKLKLYKEEVEELVASDKLVNDFRNLANRYKNSLTTISNYIKTPDKPELAELIGYINSVTQDATVLNAVNPESPNHKRSKLTQAVVTRYQKMVDSFSPKVAQTTKNQINAIVNEIPDDISPEKINLIMKNNSPTINKMVEQNMTKEDIAECLNNTISTNACNKIGIAPKERINLIQTLNNEVNGLIQNLNKAESLKVSPIGPISKEQNELNMSQNFNLVQDAHKVIKDNDSGLTQFNIALKLKDSENTNIENQNPNQKSYSEKAREQIIIKEKELVGIELLFYHFSVNMEEELKNIFIDMDTKAGAIKAIEIQKEHLDSAKSNAATFKNSCNFLGKDISDFSHETIKMCGSLVKEIVNQVKNLNQSHLYRINELSTKIKQLTSEDNFGDIESMKKYVAEKYLCSCNKDKNSISTNKESNSITLKGESCTTEFLSLTKIDGLSSSSYAIANALYAHEIKLPMDGESCAMTSERLAPFANTCKSNKFVNANFSELCKQVNSEYVVKVESAQLDTKENAEWEKFNEDNYVEYDSSSPGNYKAERKKDKWRVFGEGILPVIPNALPIWLTNFQIKNNINMLTTQGLMQKQYLHNAGIFNASPWMNNFNNFGYGNPFMISPSLQPGQTGSNGFNFNQ